MLSVLGFKTHLRNSVFVWAFPPSKERWCYLFVVVVLTAKLKKMTSLRAKKVTLVMMTQVRDDGRFGTLISYNIPGLGSLILAQSSWTRLIAQGSTERPFELCEL